IGAKVQLFAAGETQVRQLQPVSGYLASNDPVLHFGLGKHANIDRLVVRWPAGHTQELTSLRAGNLYEITEPIDDLQRRPEDTDSAQPNANTPLLRPHDLGTRIIHREVEFDDFARQPLLPNKLSQLGPSMAWGDIDGDGDDDLFLGQGAGWPGMIYTRTADGRFNASPQNAFTDHSASEDMGAVFFDVDGDNDLDLYVASGGNEFEAGDPQLRDRLYLNDGSGHFALAPENAHPQLNGSNGTVAAADFDRDGDIDLFVGGRLVPGAYPTAPTSHILRNDAGQLVDVTASVASALHLAGMVTDAVWSDFNGDGAIDLLTAHEWGPVRVWKNENGTLQPQVVDEMAQRSGWWNGIASGDFDHDGDIDYVTTNWGENTKYHASTAHPTRLYYGDFDGSGKRRLIEAEFENDTLFPMRGRSCSSRAMPFVSEKFDSFRAFATASLEEIYTPKCLDEAIRFEATTLVSGIWLNDSTKQISQFRFQTLPKIVQVSPGFGAVVSDLNGDGHLDICIAQNFYQPQWETGRMDGGLGCMLLGNGDGTFAPAIAEASGLIVPADATDIVTTDLNADGTPDLLVAVNDGELLSFVNQSSARQFISVELQGLRGNRSGVGAKLTAVSSSGATTSQEVTATRTSFGNPQQDPIQSIRVRWPDGASSNADVSSNQVTIAHPNLTSDPQRLAKSHADRKSDDAKQFAEAQATTGTRLAAVGDRDQAIVHYRHAFLADPTNTNALTRLGDASVDASEFRDADWYYEQALAIQP
ncbi:MAG: VCBS repeat-containing protein, partial [Planctomycetales bacterium]|nr:VCBS repeat-containing protein [Planctomycetales bacterium]